MEENSQFNKAYIPSKDESDASATVYKAYSEGRNIIQNSYAQFNGRTLIQAVDDWEKRWNGFIPAADALTNTQSQIFLNFTRNSVISYISKTGTEPSKAKVQAVNKKTGMVDKKFSHVCEKAIKYSQDEENFDNKWVAINLERTIKGTAIVYDSYLKEKQKMKVPDGFDMETGKGKFKEQMRTVFDNCYAKLVKVNHFFIKNPYLSSDQLQEQPWIIWEEITTKDEAERDFGKYKNFKYVIPGAEATAQSQVTFYENDVLSTLKGDQVQVLRYYNRMDNLHIIQVNGVIIYNGPIPFKDGLYPFSAYIFEPFGNDFFWGAGFPNKIMGEQDGMNTDFNLLRDKMINGAMPTGISSDLDDLIEDDYIEMGKFRKVGDINKWKFLEYPSVSGGEANFLQTTLNFARENSGDVQGLGAASTPKGGAVTARQVLLKQQESIQRMEFSMGYMETGERDRTILRLNHIFQFYSIPKLEKITGEDGATLEQMVYRDIRLTDTELTDGETGNQLIKLVNTDQFATPDAKEKLQNDMSVMEAQGEMSGTPTEVLAVNVDTFFDHNLSVQIVKNSSFAKNQALDQAMKHEYADWLMTLIPFGLQIDVQKLADWVGESYDVDVEDFVAQQPNPMQQQMGQSGGQPPTAGPINQSMGPKQMKEPALSQLMG